MKFERRRGRDVDLVLEYIRYYQALCHVWSVSYLILVMCSWHNTSGNWGSYALSNTFTLSFLSQVSLAFCTGPFLLNGRNVVKFDTTVAERGPCSSFDTDKSRTRTPWLVFTRCWRLWSKLNVSSWITLYLLTFSTCFLNRLTFWNWTVIGTHQPQGEWTSNIEVGSSNKGLGNCREYLAPMLSSSPRTSMRRATWYTSTSPSASPMTYVRRTNCSRRRASRPRPKRRTTTQKIMLMMLFLPNLY